VMVLIIVSLVFWPAGIFGNRTVVRV
jgi:hypothetical protein